MSLRVDRTLSKGKKMDYVVPAEQLPAVPVMGTIGMYPVRRIYCVGRNYGEHVKEMGGDPKKDPPVFFTKPANAVVIEGSPVHYPTETADLHHEVELVVAIGSGGKGLDPIDAQQCVYGYAVGVDLTRRDLQSLAKKGGKPWDVAKGFDDSAPISAINPITHIVHPQNARISLEVNGELRQDADIAEMIWTVPEIIAELSRYFELCAGDLIFTGTPSGVGALERGDHVKASIEGIAELVFDIV